LANMSHEIRTPMNGVLGVLEVLQQSSLAPSQQELVGLMHESADSLLRIIDDILDFSKLEAGRLAIEQVPMSIANKIESTCSLLNSVAARKSIVLTTFCDPSIPARVLGDPHRLRQVILNLTSNAIKFSCGLPRAGRVAVRATCLERSEHRVTVEIRVTDNGVGIDEVTQRRLFQPFSQADVSTTRRYGGTGLGLAISRQLVDLMGGSIVVTSRPGEGAAFALRLPFKVVADAAEETVGAVSPLARLPCLVIGNESGLAEDFATYLRHGGASVERMPDLAAARAWASAHRSEVAVWVVEAHEGLPAVTQLLAELKLTSAATRAVLVVVARETRLPEATAEGLAILDGNALSRETLLQAVAAVAGRAAEPQPAAGRTPRRGDHRRRSEPGRGKILVAEDNAINQRVIREQLGLLGYAADVVANGREALSCWSRGGYALLLADLHMPEVDGYDLALSIRAAEKPGERTPIIALTANALAGEAERCQAVGMDDYLSKPAKLEALDAMLEKWLALAGSSPQPAPAYRAEALEAFLGTDPVLIDRFLEEFALEAEQLGAEILAACQSGQPRAAGEGAHKLKSAARAVGAERLAALCDSIEAVAREPQSGNLAALAPAFRHELALVSEELARRERPSAISALTASGSR
ncbi:MAG TPA: ATP-binding protein, partial [Steroidobacteraceae bacterium]|nr:ATP-binding protein [Steroidobacteraceae bacterium]